MTEQTDAEFIAEMQAMEAKATPGPWTREKPKPDPQYGFSAGVAIAATYGRQLIYANPPGGSFPSFDADFIAAARTAIPRLIGMVEERERERERDESKKNTAKLFRERRAFWDALIPPGPRCRDCADCNGRCQDTGHPCDPQEHALEIIANLKTAAARAEKAEAERDTALASEAELRERISRLHIRGGHQSWCALFGETVDWDDELIHRIEPFVIKLIEEIQDELTRSFNGREREIFKTKVRRALDAETERDAALAESAKLRAALIPIVDEFSCTIEQYNKIGPDFTHKDGTEVFTVQTVLDREPLIVAARDAFAPKETP